MAKNGGNKTKILIVFYSMTGNVAILAKEMESEAKKEGADVLLRQVKELIPEERFTDQMKKTKSELKNIPLVTKDDLVWADGIAFGAPTRYGNMAAQMKFFIDGTGDLWMKGLLIGKVATLFTSVSTQHGGHETTILTAIPPLLHHGMIFIGIPYSEPKLMQIEYVGGGSPYGASSTSGPMSQKPPTQNDLIIARTQIRRLIEITKKMNK